MQKYFLNLKLKMPRCKYCFANVYFWIIDKITLNLSSNLTLIELYRSFSMQFRWNNLS